MIFPTDTYSFIKICRLKMDGDGGMEEEEIDIGMRERSNTWHGSRVNYKELVPSFDTINEKVKLSYHLHHAN